MTSAPKQSRSRSKRVNVRKVAQRAGVSVGTVSRVLNGFEDVSPVNRRRVQSAVAALGYQPTDNPWKPARRRKLTRTIVAPINSQYSLAFVEHNLLEVEPYLSFAQTLKEKRFRIDFDFVAPDQMERRFHELVRSPQRCDGVLVLSDLCTQAISDELRAQRFPHVSYDLRAERYQINTVHAHVADGMARAVEHLQALGHRRIGYFGRRGDARHAMAIATLAAAGMDAGVAGGGLTGMRGEDLFLKALPAVHGEAQLRDFSRDQFGAWLDRGRLGRPDAATALICSKDYFALGAADALRDRGLTPGHDLSLVGYENVEARGRPPQSPANQPILTTIDNPADRIGRRMAELLLNQVYYGQTDIVHERLPTRLIVRSSTGSTGSIGSTGLRPTPDSAADSPHDSLVLEASP